MALPIPTRQVERAIRRRSRPGRVARERRSNLPIAVAILRECDARGPMLPNCTILPMWEHADGAMRPLPVLRRQSASIARVASSGACLMKHAASSG